MRILCVFGRHNYGDPARGEGVEYTHFLPALRALGHETFFFESFSRAGYANFAGLNRALLERVEEVQPDLVFTVLMLAEVWLDSIALMRQAGCAVVNWSTDDSWKYRQFSRLIAADFDLYATTCPDAPAWYARDRINNSHLTQWAASASWLAPPKPASECRYPVSFIGSAYGSRPARVAALRRAGISVECFGHGWPNGPVPAERIPEIIRDSIVSLNFSEAGGGGSGRQLKARLFEVPAVGGMLITEPAPYLDRFFAPREELIIFRSDAELVDAVRQILAEPTRRDAIAHAGHRRVAQEHTYDLRLKELFAQLHLEPPHRRKIDWVEFNRIELAHTSIGFCLELLRVLFVWPCTLIWGPVRGPRAARRGLFELSWRLFGRRTYTAAGLPGRLFYRES